MAKTEQDAMYQSKTGQVIAFDKLLSNKEPPFQLPIMSWVVTVPLQRYILKQCTVSKRNIWCSFEKTGILS